LKAAARIEAIRARAKLEPLVVLVWGPGDPGVKARGETRKYWEKRKQIRDKLAKEFPQAEVFFSESDALRDHTRDLDSLLTEELVHAAAADCILVLDVTRGAHVEVDRFSDYASVAKKLRVLLPAKHVGGSGFVNQIHGGLKVTGFTDDEFKKCTLASEITVKIVLSVAIERLMASGFS
jgi:hypothetical protein